MGIKELCNKEALNESSTTITTSANNFKDITLELLYRYSNTLIIDKTALKMDGYQITIN